ncbi:MAG: Gfo/Idh/MocA family protein [Prosthecobacter sp.]|uniref:Gfo/Idh/MocA family protein n=1 Tax=Prosthecobacter sp. TaxID=1965333 RepID=UPI0038FFD227
MSAFPRMNFSIIGTGYVADMYPVTLGNHPGLKFTGAWDSNESNLDAFLKRWPVKKYASLEDLLADESVQLVLNLTNPRSHFEITRRCLEAGKHVYSEKPMGMTINEARGLADLAAAKNLLLVSAPCSVLSTTAQTLWQAVRAQVIGKVRLVYANFDDGMIAPRQQPWCWKSASGVPWPAKDEFEIGCTYEHAGYVLTWLAAMFGPAKRVTSFASCQIPDKGIAVESMAPDFTVGCIEYADNVVARVTCGLVAPLDKSLTVIGDNGELFVGNVRNDVGPVFHRRAGLSRLQGALARRPRWLMRWLESRFAISCWPVLFQRKLPPFRPVKEQLVGPDKPVDFLRGPAEMAAAIREQRPCRLSAELGVHIVEIVEALQHPERCGGRKEMTTTFAPMSPLS